jgi:hypothetical protein
VIAREDAQAAGVDRQRFVHTELGREIRRQHLHVGMMLVEPALFFEVLLKRCIHARQLRQVTIVLRRFLQRFLRD